MATMAEYRVRLDAEPLTPKQRGRVMAEFERLGFHPRYDRAERLRLLAELAEVPEVASVKGLTQGQAGRVIRALGRCRTARDLYAEPEPRPLIPPAVLAAYSAWLRTRLALSAPPASSAA